MQDRIVINPQEALKAVEAAAELARAALNDRVNGLRRRALRVSAHCSCGGPVDISRRFCAAKRCICSEHMFGRVVEPLSGLGEVVSAR